jgi:hypothetical protein
LKLKNTPELALKGANRLHQKRLMYTTKDVDTIIQYANNRGVRVIPEIDMVKLPIWYKRRHGEPLICNTYSKFIY